MYPDLELVDDLRVLAEEGSFGGAASRLHLSVSAVSRRLRRLEHQVGAPLALRGPGGFLGLTDAGDRLLRAAAPVMAAAAKLPGNANGSSRVIRLGVPGAPEDHFPDWQWRVLQRAFTERTGGLRLVIVGVPYAACTAAVSQGLVDVMVAQVEPELAGLCDEYVMTDRRLVMLPPGHELLDLAVVTVSDILDLPLVREPSTSERWFAPWLLDDLETHRRDRVVHREVRSFAEVADLVVSLSVATVTSATMRGLAPDVPTRLVADAPPMQVRAQFRTDSRVPGVAVLVDLMRTFGYVLDQLYEVGGMTRPALSVPLQLPAQSRGAEVSRRPGSRATDPAAGRSDETARPGHGCGAPDPALPC